MRVGVGRAMSLPTRPTSARLCDYRCTIFPIERREWSAIRNVARSTATDALQRGHFGLLVLPVTPSR